MSSSPPGWYADPNDATQLLYWNGVNWTDDRMPAPPYLRQVGFPADLYDANADLERLLTQEQRDFYSRHQLTSYPVWLVVLLHYVTFGLFTLIHQGYKFSKLPVVRHDDFGSGKAIGFMFIPFFSLYWMFRFVLSGTDRLNFQYRVRGLRPPISRGLGRTCCIVQLIPYVNIVVGYLFLIPIAAAQWQSAANKLADEGQLLALRAATAPPLPPPANA